MPFLCCCSLQRNGYQNHPIVMFDLSCSDSFPIRSLSGHDTLAFFHNDFENELYPSPFVITGEKPGKYMISVVINDNLVNGLVDNDIPMCIQLRQDGSTTVPIYGRASLCSTKQMIGYGSFISRTPDSHPIVYGFKSDWLKVSYYDKHNHKRYGWLNKINQCDNPYSTCN